MHDDLLNVMRRWEKGRMERDLLTKMPVWVRFPNLPIEFWSTDTIGRAVSTLGKPLYLEGPTGRKDRLSYARCCVEIGVHDEFKNEVVICHGGLKHT